MANNVLDSLTLAKNSMASDDLMLILQPLSRHENLRQLTIRHTVVSSEAAELL